MVPVVAWPRTRRAGDDRPRAPVWAFYTERERLAVMATKHTIEFGLAAVISILEQPVNNSLARCVTEVTISPGESAALLAHYRCRVARRHATAWVMVSGCGVMNASWLTSPFGHALAALGWRPGWRRRRAGDANAKANVLQVQRLNRFHINEISVTRR